MKRSCDDSGSSEDDWTEDEDVELLSLPTQCLFCSEIFKSPELLFDHCSSEHDININDCLKKYASDAISFIKLVNFIRDQKPLPSEFPDILSLTSWQDDKYMKPVVDDDNLLTFDVESYIEDKSCHAAKSETEDIIVPKYEYNTLLEKMKTYHLQLQQCQIDMEKMRQTMQDLLLMQESNEKPPKEDNEYFLSYSHYGIHQEMLQDRIRTEAYKTAIMSNSDIFANKIVLDVGCGTAILSMFCASAGARKVISIDQSDIIYQAMQIVRENNLENVIDLQKGRIEDIKLPIDKVDIIVSEWMGYFLLYEDMIDAVIYARNRYLNHDGFLFPNRCSLSLVAVSDIELPKKYISFWDNVYGYKMMCMKKDVVEEAMIELICAEKICSKPALIKEFDLLTCSSEETEFCTNFELEITKDGLVTAFAAYFDCYFDDRLATPVQLSTSPLSEPTHWKQTVFLLSSSKSAKQGDIIQGKMMCHRSCSECRSLIITIATDDNSQKYFLK